MPITNTSQLQPIYRPSDLKHYTENQIIRKGNKIYLKAGTKMKHSPEPSYRTSKKKQNPKPSSKPPYPTELAGTKVTKPGFLKYYKEKELIRKGGDIYLRKGIKKRW